MTGPHRPTAGFAGTPPTLLAVAHGTREADGVATTEALVARVRALRPELRVERCFLDLVSPSLPQALARLRGEVVLVPLLLGAGYHIRVDIPAALADAPHLRARVARALGPDPLLAEALADRLDEAGWLGPAAGADGRAAAGASRSRGAETAGAGAASAGAGAGAGTSAGAGAGAGTSAGAGAGTGTSAGAGAGTGTSAEAGAGTSALVLAAAGSTDPAANADTAAMAELLRGRLPGLPAVVPAYLCAAGPTPAEAVAALHAAGHERVAVASYLLGPGYFARRATQAGAHLTSAPLGPHDALARLVTLRYDEALRDRRRGPLEGRTGAHSGRMLTPG